MANDDTVAACRAALLDYADAKHGTKASAVLYGDRFIRVDDAAACMAEREAKLRMLLEDAGYAPHVIDEALATAQAGSTIIDLMEALKQVPETRAGYPRREAP